MDIIKKMDERYPFNDRQYIKAAKRIAKGIDLQNTKLALRIFMLRQRLNNASYGRAIKSIGISLQKAKLMADSVERFHSASLLDSNELERN